jgi:hypothetical protein
MQFKPDFETTAQRFEAWWQGEVLDRPPVTLSVRPRREYSGPQKSHATQRERWLDAEFQVETAVARLACAEFAGDTMPIFMPNIGPEITATLYGCELDFSETTSWSRPVVSDIGEWERIAAAPPDWENDYWRAIERMTDYALEICDGRFLVGITDLHGNYDILVALRDPQELCLDLMDDPELVRRAGAQVSRAYVAALERLYRKIAARGCGATTWLPMYHPGPAYVPSCDFWCMVSDDIARDLILPDIVEEMRPLERSIFHLDGPQALRHLDLLLDLPQLDAVQWVYGAGCGPAARWMDVYRRIQKAGKSFQVIAQDAADAFAVLEAVGPRGAWFVVDGTFETGETNDFLRAVESRSAG